MWPPLGPHKSRFSQAKVRPDQRRGPHSNHTAHLSGALAIATDGEPGQGSACAAPRRDGKDQGLRYRPKQHKGAGPGQAPPPPPPRRLGEGRAGGGRARGAKGWGRGAAPGGGRERGATSLHRPVRPALLGPPRPRPPRPAPVARTAESRPPTLRCRTCSNFLG